MQQMAHVWSWHKHHQTTMVSCTMVVSCGHCRAVVVVQSGKDRGLQTQCTCGMLVSVELTIHASMAELNSTLQD